MVERCDKCGKPFMDKSEVNRHKMYEHSVPVSPFEENKEGAVIYESINPKRKETGNRDDSSHPEELQKSIITTTSNTPINVDTTKKGENNINSNSNYNNSKGINITQNRSKGFRSIRM
jgi:hypothetical protein